MKIPASSSFFLASLAISSSSSCLAAPAGTQPQDPGSSTPTSTGQDAPSTTSSNVVSEGKTVFVDGQHISLGARDDADTARLSLPPLDQIISNIPIIGGPLAQIISPAAQLAARAPGSDQSADGDGSSSAASFGSQDMEAFRSAAQELSRALGGAYANPSVQDTVGGTMASTPAGNIASGVADNTPAGGVVNGAPAAPDVPGVVTGAVGKTPLTNTPMGSGAKGYSNAASGSSTYTSSTPPGPTPTAANTGPSDSTSTMTYSSAASSPSQPANPPNTPNTSDRA